jgi:hypothetical protein
MVDGFLASFTSTQRALDCATALQQAFNSEHMLKGMQEPIRVSELEWAATMPTSTTSELGH